jgi:predicted DNA-binding transcriptional regulator YafY
MIDRRTLNAAAAAFNVSRKTAAKWWARYRTLGVPGLRDRSSCPLHSPRRTSSELIAQVIALRRELRPAYQIAQATRLSPATIAAFCSGLISTAGATCTRLRPSCATSILPLAICCTSTSRV